MGCYHPKSIHLCCEIFSGPVAVRKWFSFFSVTCTDNQVVRNMDAPELSSSAEEREGEIKIVVRLTLLDEAHSATSNASPSDADVTSDIDIWMTKDGCIAELKAILESQDLLPSDSEPFIVEVRLSPTATVLLRDEDVLPENTEMVHVTTKHSAGELVWIDFVRVA